MNSHTAEVVHAADEHCFTVSVEGQDARLDYVREGDVLAITHTVVPPAIGGRGIAARLVEAAFAQARAQGWKVRADCAYAANYADKHPELAGLLA